MSLQLDKRPTGRQKWVGVKDLCLSPTQKEGWSRNRDKLRHPNDQGGRPVANIAARKAGYARKTRRLGILYGFLGRRTYARGAAYRDGGRLTGIGSLQRGHRRGGRNSIPRERAPAGFGPAPPAFDLTRFPKYSGPVFLAHGPKVARLRRSGVFPTAGADAPGSWPRSRLSVGLRSARAISRLCGAGCDAECVVAHPSAPSFGKPRHGGLRASFSRAQSAGLGAFCEPGYEGPLFTPIRSADSNGS